MRWTCFRCLPTVWRPVVFSRRGGIGSSGNPGTFKLFRPGYSLLLLVALAVINRFTGYTIVGVAGNSISNFIIAILVHRSVYNPTSRAGLILNWKPLAFVGTLSYSLYLWQQLFVNRYSDGWINAFPQNVILAVCVALISYQFLEKPLLKLRHRLRA